MSQHAIETRYKGYRFRSRLEARWAVFLDALGIPYEYEKEGYRLPAPDVNLHLEGWADLIDPRAAAWLSAPHLSYLPDFWLPRHKCWIEIKGPRPDREEIEKACRLVASSHCPLFILIGEIPSHVDQPFSGQTIACLRGPEGVWVQEQYTWRECAACQRFSLRSTAAPDRSTANTPEWADDIIARHRETQRSLWQHWDDCGDPALLDHITAVEHLVGRLRDHRRYFVPTCCEQYETKPLSAALATAYVAARSARFEHGEQG